LKKASHKFRSRLVVAAVITAAATVFVGGSALAGQVLSSPNYEVVNPTFSAGGQSSSSTLYSSTQTIGTPDTGSVASTNYKSFFGFRFQAYPGIPGTPTITNTGGNLYNTLNFVITTGNDTSDTNFAVAISPDAFVSTTYYLQNNDTLGSSAYWQNYTAWGGVTGQLITGLSPGTTYTIKVKARYSANTESGFSSTASAATVSPSISFSISGVSLGTNLAGVTTTIGTSSTAMSFSTLPVGSSVIAAQTLSVTTNATGGYTTTLFQDGNLRNSINQIQPVSASNASPAAWPSTVTTSAFGYHTTAATLCTGTLTRFSSNNTYAAVTTTPSEVACSSAAVTAASTSIVYQLQIGNLQQAGNYTNTITYITTAIY
jgi:hypothetical protein